MKSKRKAGPAGRREFSEEFKAEAVRLAAERRAAGGTLTQVGRELDVRPDQLRAWAKRQGCGSDGAAAIPGETIEQENRWLRREGGAAPEASVRKKSGGASRAKRTKSRGDGIARYWRGDRGASFGCAICLER